MLNAKIELTRSDSFQLHVKLDINQPGIYALFGPSGSGKTTLLRTLSGLVDKKDRSKQNDRSNVTIGLNSITYHSNRRFIPAHRRPIAYLSQHDDLFTHLSVQGNLSVAARYADTRNAKAFTNKLIDKLKD